MPTPTYTALASVTLASTASTITFSSLPTSGYRDLVLVGNGQFSGNGGVGIRFNGDTGVNYPQVYMWGTNAAQSGTNGGTGFYPTSSGVLSGARFDCVVNIMDYGVTDKQTTALSRSGYTLTSSIQTVETSASRWANTAAVTTIGVFSTNNVFAIGTTFAVYGIAS